MRRRRPQRAEKNVGEAAPAAVLAELWGFDAAPAAWTEEGSEVGKAHARLETSAGPVCLRRLPRGVSPAWLGAIQDAVEDLTRQGFVLFPRFIPTETGDLATLHAGFWYDLTAWPSGAPVPAASLSDEQLSHLAAAVARLHRAGAGASGPPVRFDWLTPRQAATQRLAWDPIGRGKNAWQNPGNLAAFFDALPTDDERVAASATLRETRDLARRILGQLGPTPLQALADAPPTLTHGDLWVDHVRFVGPEVSALLDLDTLALRPPGGDVAALCADFALWEPRRCRIVLDSYLRALPLTPEAVAELPALGALRALGVIRARITTWLDAAGHDGSEEELARAIAFWRSQLRGFLSEMR